MSPLSSPTNLPPSAPNADTANQVQAQPQDPGQARFAEVLRQRQAASPAPGKALKEAPRSDPSADARQVSGLTAALAEGTGDGRPDPVLDAGMPGSALDPAQLPPVWTPLAPILQVAVPAAMATSIPAEMRRADASANPIGAMAADPTARLLEAGAGNGASRGVEAQSVNGRSLRADVSGLRMAALRVEGAVDQPDAIAQPGTTAGSEARVSAIALDAPASRTDTLAWGATPLPAEASAPRHAGPAPHTVSVESRVGSPRFADETAQQVTWLARNGIEHAEIRVKPAELGPISVRIEMQNNEAVISFAVTQPETRVAVEDALHRLQEMLAESGISMGETSVGDQSFGQQLRDDRGSSWQRQTFGPRGQTPVTPIGGLVARTPLAARGLVDTFA